MILTVIQLIILILLGAAVLYILVFSIAGLFYRQRKYVTGKVYRKIAVFIPGYKEDEVIVEVVGEALKQQYPRESFDVIVIADSFQTETLDILRKMPLKLIEVSFELSTKAKALNKAMDQLGEDYDLALVLDADNIMERDFLDKMNTAFEADFVAIQGHRVAKNMNTSFAVLDAISEEINNHIFRKGHRVLGLSSAIIGSGMVFRYDLFRSLMKEATAVGGFDKELELRLLSEGYKIDYLEDALVYDEKVQKAGTFSNQRRRWLAAQFYYFRRDIVNAFRLLLTKGNVDYFDKALQFIQPPRILLLAGVLLFGSVFILYNMLFLPHSDLTAYWIMLIVFCIAAFLIAIPVSFYNMRTVMALGTLPRGILLMLISLLKIRGANRKFIHTQHGKV